MELTDVVQVNISLGTANPSTANFGTLMCACYTANPAITDRVTSYKSFAAVKSAFTSYTSDPFYSMAQKAFSQSPAPSEVKLGKRVLGYTQSFTITIGDSTQGDVYNFSVGKVGASLTSLTYTVLSSATTSTVATAIASLITGASISSITSAVAVGAVITVTSVANTLTDFVFDPSRTKMSVHDTTSDGTNLTTDLNAIQAADGDFYALAIDTTSLSGIEAAAAWQESRGFGSFYPNSSDSVIATATTTSNVAYDLKTSAYERTFLTFSGAQLCSFSGAARACRALPQNPGSYTEEFKTLSGVTPDKISDSEQGHIWGYNCATYQTLANTNLTANTQGSLGKFPDLVRFLDWYSNTTSVGLLTLLANSQKVPYTDSGVALAEGVVRGVTNTGIAWGGIAATPTPVVTAPLVASQLSSNKLSRIFAGLSASWVYASAIHKFIPVNVTVTE